MATNPNFDAYFQSVASRLASKRARGSAGFQSQLNAPSQFLETDMTGGDQKQTDWNLGQGIIDTLSSGTYAVAGLGARMGESFDKLSRGDFSNVGEDVLGMLPGSNFFGVEGGLFGAAGKGIQDKRTWAENLRDANPDSDPAAIAAGGLALDILLDPTWIVGGGAITAGAKGTAAGIKAASAANKAGIQLSKAGFAEAGKAAEQIGGSGVAKAIQNVPDAAGKGWFQQTNGKINMLSGDAFNNLLQGVKQGNVEAFAQLRTDKYNAKLAKAARKEAKRNGTNVINNPVTLVGTKLPKVVSEAETAVQDITRADQNVEEVVAKAQEDAVSTQPNQAPQDVIDATPTPVDTPVQQAVETVKEVARTTKRKQKAPITKDANVVNETVETQLDLPSINKASRDQVGAMKQAYLDARGIKPVPADFAAIKASPDAPRIAKAYEDMVSDPTNPAVIRAYRALAREVADQYKYMTEELGIKVDFSDADPYNVINEFGQSVPDSKLFMQDILENGHLTVRDSAPDFALDPHPLLSVEENNMFRAVHDFFGHAASGRGVAQDGEEAAWVSHSQMFSTEARKAMTTETRGQNSWRNTEGYGFDPSKPLGDDARYSFAQQKAGFLPDEYVLTPNERAFLDELGLKSNSFIGAVGERLVDFADTLLFSLGRVSTPSKHLAYAPEQLKAMEKPLKAILESEEGLQPGSLAHKELSKLFGFIELAVIKPSSTKFASPFDTGLSNIANNKETKDFVTGDQAIENLAGYYGPEALFDPEMALAGADEASNLKALDTVNADIQKEAGGVLSQLGAQKTKMAAREAAMKLSPKKAGAKLAEINRADTLSLMGVLQKAYETTLVAENTTPLSQAARALMQLLDYQVDATPLIVAGLKAEGRTAESIKPFVPTFWGITGNKSTNMTKVKGEWTADRSVYGQPNFAVEELRRLFPNDPLLSNPKDLELAMGTKKLTARHSSTKQREAQDRIWEAFRARNADTIAKIEIAEREIWQGQINDLGDDLYYMFADGLIKNGGKLPANIPVGAITTHNGQPRTTIGKLLQNLWRVRETKNLGGPARAVKINGKRVLLENGTIPASLQEFLVTNLRKLTNIAENRPISLFNQANDITELAAKIYARVPGLRAASHAKLLAAGGVRALKDLSKIKRGKYYIPAEIHPTRGIPMLENVGRKTSKELEVMRDPATGYPLKVKKGVETPVANIKEATKLEGEPRVNLQNTEGNPWFGRQQAKPGSPYASQTGEGSQQLGVLQAVREGIKSISESTDVAKAMQSSPEQAQLLTSVLRDLNIKVAADATPEEIFKLFKTSAALRFEEVIAGIEQSARIESVGVQTFRLFSTVSGSTADFMKAVEKLDSKTVQEAVINFSDEALRQVDDYCRDQYALKTELGDLIG